MSIKQILDDHSGETLTLVDSYLIGSSWTYYNGLLIRSQRVLLGTDNIHSISCIEDGDSLLFTLENKAKVKMSYEDEEIILRFPGFSETKHCYKDFIWS